MAGPSMATGGSGKAYGVPPQRALVEASRTNWWVLLELETAQKRAEELGFGGHSAVMSEVLRSE